MTGLKSFVLKTKFFYCLVFGIFIALLMRNSALYPSIFADEYSYSTASRLLPLSQAPIANYLYLFVFRLTNVCGDGFLSCARILNTVFFILACPFIYQTAKRVCSKSVAKYIALLSLIGPINIYTANFMPEAMYFLAFWIFTWYTLGLNSTSSLKSWLGVGVLIGMCMLIKPHGVFLLPPTCLYVLILFANHKPLPIKKMLLSTLLIVLAALITKFLFGFLVAGPAGMSVMGHLYSTTTEHFVTATKGVAQASQVTEIASNTAAATKESSSLISQWLIGLPALLAFWSINLRGHLLGLVLLYGLPLLVMVRLLRFKSHSNDLGHTSESNKAVAIIAIQSRYAWFTFLIGASLVLFSSLFAGFVGLTYGGEILRMHMRYYNFAFPLLLMLLPCIYSVATEKRLTQKLALSEWLFWGLITLIVIWGIWKMMLPYQPTAIDTPELRGITQLPWFFYLMSSLGLACILSWPFLKTVSVALFFWIVTPLLLIGGTIAVNHNIWENTKPDIYDRAGIAVKQILSHEEIAQLVVVGENPIALSKVLFYLDEPRALMQLIPGNITYDLKMLPPGKKWVLLMDGHPMDRTIQNQLYFNGYILGGGSGKIKVDFRNQSWPSKDLIYTRGLFMPPEPWGTWTIDKTAVLAFSRALPEKFTLTMRVKAFGPNIGSPSLIRVGGYNYTFVGTQNFESILINIENPSRQNAITFEVFEPKSPKNLGLSDDPRTLGVAISELSINW